MFRHMNRPEIWQPGNNSSALSDYQNNYGGKDNELKEIINKITANSKFKIKNNDDKNQVFTIKSVEVEKRYNYTNYQDLVDAYYNYALNGDYANNFKPTFTSFCAAHNRRITYKLNLGSEHNFGEVFIGGSKVIEVSDSSSTVMGSSSAISLQFVTEKTSDNTDSIVSNNPAIFEYDYEAIKERMYSSGICEELMANRFHPSNIPKFGGWGFEDMVPECFVY